jgi:GNAT superfamily N-acetyltransferase
MTGSLIPWMALLCAPATALVTQLGYPTAPAEMEARLRRLLSHPDYTTIVAEASGRIIGMVGAYQGLALELDTPYALLTALVVDAGWRGRGLGKLLMRRMEGWCREQGASSLLLNSGKQRLEAHKFYEAIGYQATGVRFAKRL